MAKKGKVSNGEKTLRAEVALAKLSFITEASSALGDASKHSQLSDDALWGWHVVMVEIHRELKSLLS
jgi:hypothetical protein